MCGASFWQLEIIENTFVSFASVAYFLKKMPPNPDLFILVMNKKTIIRWFFVWMVESILMV
jgi:hypothetical protein